MAKSTGGSIDEWLEKRSVAEKVGLIERLVRPGPTIASPRAIEPKREALKRLRWERPNSGRSS